MNTEKAIERIANHNGGDKIWKWAENIAMRHDALHRAGFAVLNKICDECPFRNNKKMGGCITDACPVNNVCNAINALSDKARDIAKKARNRQAKIAMENWKKERGL